MLTSFGVFLRVLEQPQTESQFVRQLARPWPADYDSIAPELPMIRRRMKQLYVWLVFI